MAAGVLVGLASLTACGHPATFSDEFVCGNIQNRDGSEIFVPSPCDADDSAERFFLFTAPFENYNADDIDRADGRYRLPRFYHRYRDDNDGTYTSIYDYDWGRRRA